MDNIPSVLTGKSVIDDRGSLGFVNEFNPMSASIKRFYIVNNHNAMFIRAWHGHNIEEKYAMVIEGVAMFIAIPINIARTAITNLAPVSLDYKFVLSSTQPSILHIPGGYIHGSMTYTSNTKILYYSTSTLEESKLDDIRFSSSMWSDLWRIEQR